MWNGRLSLAIGLIGLFSTSAVAQQPCPIDRVTQGSGTGGAGVQAVLKDIPTTTKWADLPDAVRARLKRLADDRLAAHRARWSAPALAVKLTVLLDCPTPAMTAAIDDFYRKVYDTVVPPTFSLKDVSAPFVGLLVRHYLGMIAARRASLTYPAGKVANLDWDGVSVFDSTRLSDERTATDIGRFSADLLIALRQLNEATLSNLEKALRQHVLFDVRANAAAVFDGVGYRGVATDTPCDMVDGDWDILAGYQLEKQRPRIFASDDEVLSEANAIYFHNTQLRWLDVGTWASARSFCNYTGGDFLKKRVGDPASNEVAKGMTLLRNWWIERVSAFTDANKKCTAYSAADRVKVWETFSAAQLFNNDGSSSMGTYRTLLETYVANKRSEYRIAARAALDLVFPDDAVLTSAQRQQVAAIIASETAFGLIADKVAAALDAAQGSQEGPAVRVWRQAIASNVVRIGGNYNANDPVRPDDEAALKAMFGEVKSWLARRYQGLPIDIAAIVEKLPFEVTTEHGASTFSGGKIEIGVGTARSKMEYYSWIIHEVRHAVYRYWQANAPDPSQVKTDDGPVLEGSGVAAEALLLPAFLKHILNNETGYALYVLDYAIRDARFAGTTDATLQRYFRESCSAPDDLSSIDFAKSIANRYGLTGRLADTAAIRSHADTQYLQYIWGGLQVLDDIAYLQEQVGVGGKRTVDPFVLFACGLNTPRRDAAYVAALKACIAR